MNLNLKSFFLVTVTSSVLCMVAAKSIQKAQKPAISISNQDYALDTVPRKPIYPPDTNDLIHLKIPNDISNEVDFEPKSNEFIISNKIGNDDINPAIGLGYDEYFRLRTKEQENQYFEQLAGISNGIQRGSATDPMKGFVIKNSIIEKLFGSSTIDIKPSGNVDIPLGFFSNYTENPAITENQRRQTGFDFRPTFNFSVQGKVGDRLNLNGSWNTGSQFDFDNIIKVNYDGAKLGEDAILKKIEAGNVSLPLRSTLITGSQSLFGIRADLQFGKLKISSIVSNQKSERKQVQIQGGGQIQNFSIPIDQYDENKHFLLSQYNRQIFNESLRTLPQINTFFNLTDIEVWVTNDRQETEDVRDVVALADLGEGKRVTTFLPSLMDTSLILHPSFDRKFELPNNQANKLYQRLAIDDSINTRPLSRVVNTLESDYGMQSSRDFEKIRARRLTAGTDFTFNPQLGFISLNISLRPDQVVGVSYRYRYNDKIYQVGEFSYEVPVNPDEPNAIFVKLLKATTQKTTVRFGI